MINPYFLTQQSANLIEDFVREISRGSSLFLLYGESGVGKSSLLRQIRDKRLTDVNTHWIDFNKTSNGTGDEVSSSPTDLAQALKTLAEKAEVGDVIFVDHFEAASNRAQHQLFESWSIDGRDKQLNFIVAAESSSFIAFRQLAQQMQIEARSFQLMPCSQVEAEAYVQFVLFSEEPFAKLLMPRSLKSQLRACGGVFGSLSEFAEREGEQIGVDRHVDEKSNVMPSVIIGLLLFVIIGAGYVFYSMQIVEEPVAAKIDQDLNHEAQSKNDRATIVAEPLQEPPTNQLDQIDEQIEVGKVAAEITVQSQPLSETIAADTTEKKSIDTVTTETGATVTEATDTEATKKVTAVEVETGVNWFQSMLDDSKKWIKNGNSKSGTIQIMSVSFDRFAPSAFEKYLQTLQSKNIDVSQFRIFQSKVNNSKIYTVVYGEYPSRREAGLKIKALPKALVAAKPFPRTIGGILKEIEKMEINRPK